MFCLYHLQNQIDVSILNETKNPLTSFATPLLAMLTSSMVLIAESYEYPYFNCLWKNINICGFLFTYTYFPHLSTLGFIFLFSQEQFFSKMSYMSPSESHILVNVYLNQHCENSSPLSFIGSVDTEKLDVSYILFLYYVLTSL